MNGMTTLRKCFLGGLRASVGWSAYQGRWENVGADEDGLVFRAGRAA